MKEARIILPLGDNLGKPLDHWHELLMSELCTIFGGATRSATEGIWKSPTSNKVYREPGFAYDVAMEETNATRAHLETIAKRFAGWCGQECVYIRHANGEVAFVEPHKQPAVA